MADKDKPEQAEGDQARAPAGKAGSPSLLPIMLGMLIGVPLICYLMIEFLVMPKLVAAVGAAPAHAGGGEAAAAGAHGAAASKEQTADFGKIMVNVASSGDNRYLRINLVFAGASPNIKEIVKSNDVALRDAVITLLSSQSLADLEKSDGRETVRRALLARINGVLGGPVITQIYFTEFVIQ